MNFTSPVKWLENVSKKGRVSDAFIVVLSTWIVLLGLAVILLAQRQALGAAEFSWALVMVSLAVLGGWFILTGLSFILAQAVGGKGEYRELLIAVGYAMIPLAIFGLMSILFVFVANLVGIDPLVISGLAIFLTWVGMLLGVPGVYLAHALRAVTKINGTSAGLISMFMVVITAGLLIWQNLQHLGA